MNQAGSTLASPAAVANATGQTDAIAMRKTIAWSHSAYTITASGIQESGLIMRNNWNGELLSSRNLLLRPMRMPIGTPTAMAMESPRPMR